MPFIGVLKVKQPLCLKFQASLASPQLAVVTVHWTARAGQKVPDDTVEIVGPGNAVTLFDAPIPAEARLLVVDVNLAEPDGRGVLEVTHQGKALRGQFQKDESWVFSLE